MDLWALAATWDAWEVDRFSHTAPGSAKKNGRVRESNTSARLPARIHPLSLEVSWDPNVDVKYGADANAAKSG